MGKETEQIDFGEMNQELKKVSQELPASEFTAGETLQELPQGDAKKDLEVIKEGIEKRKELALAREVLGVGEESEDAVIERVIALDSKLGEKYQSLRPELKIEIAKLPEVGIPLKRTADGELEKGQEVTLENIAFVRVTDDLPIEQDGQKIIQLPYEATKDTDDPVYRLTTHWTSNFVVATHIYGDFDDRAITLIVPGQDMLKKNESPQNLASVDTFWNKNLVLPESTITISNRPIEKPGDVNLQKGDDPREVAHLCLGAMGYTVVKDHPTYTETPFDQGVIDLAHRIGVKESNLHLYTESKETAIENFFHPDFGETPSLALKRMVRDYWTEIPEKIKISVFERFSELGEMDISEEKKHTLYRAVEEILMNHNKEFSPENVTEFMGSLSYSSLKAFIVNESNYWSQKEGIEVNEMYDQYLEALEGIIDEETISKLKEELK